MLIHDYLIKSAERFPDKVAVIQKGKKMTYGEIFNASQSIASWLIKDNFHPGDRVAILMDDPVEYITSYFGILMAGGIVVALNTQTSVRSLRYQLNHCRITTVLTHFKFRKYFMELSGSIPNVKMVVFSGLQPGMNDNAAYQYVDLNDILTSKPDKTISLSDTSTSNIAQIIYTSGTTGEPNGVMLSHNNLASNTVSVVKYLKLTEKDRIMAVLPFFYSYGNSLLLTHFAVGGSIVVNQNFLYPNVILDEMVEEKVTGFSGVPSTFAILLNRSAIRNYKFSDLRYVTQAGGAMAPKFAQKLKEILPDTDIYIMYGQTEASARLSYLEPKELFRKTGSIGKAIPGVDLKVLNNSGNPVKVGEVGEIVAQGDNIMVGYWEQQEKTNQVLKNKRLWTGDLAKKDEEGFIYLVSRKSDIIKSGAHRIGPKEIEEVILECPAVHEVAVVGVNDEILGEAIKACIVLKDRNTFNKKDIRKYCRRNLPAYKCPQYVEFYKDLPKTSSGKIKKNEFKNGSFLKT